MERLFIAPDRESVEGTILFNMPADYQGKRFTMFGSILKRESR